MPPKKNPNTVARTPKRARKEKPPPLKVPSIRKVTIPKTRTVTTRTAVNGRTPILNVETENNATPIQKRNLANIDRANEVANAQLNKNAVILKFDEPITPKKRGRKPMKKNIPAAPVTEETETKEIKEPKKTDAKFSNLTRTIVNNQAVKRGRSKVSKTEPPAKKTMTQSKITNYSVEAEATPRTTPRRILRRKNNKGNDEDGKEVETSRSLEAEDVKPPPNNDIDCKPSISGISDKSCLHWTKDISSSASSISVHDNIGNVLIDGKIPVLRIENISLKRKAKKPPKSDPVSHLSDSETSESGTGVTDTSASVSVGLGCNRSVNLSMSLSSISSTNTLFPSPRKGQSTSKVGLALEKLSNKLKEFDLEFINWISYKDEESDDLKKMRKKVLDVLKEENEIIIHCQHIKRVLADKNLNTKDIDENHTDIDNKATVEEFSKPPSAVPKLVAEEIAEENTSPRSDRLRQSRDAYDDDDAISLYADSITGLESVKLHNSANTSNLDVNESEEYVPKPVRTSNVKFNYQPTKIVEETPNETVPNNQSAKTVERQNADSTSIYKETDKDDDFNYVSPKNPEPLIQQSPDYYRFRQILLMSAHYKPTQGVKSNVFKKVCFYNLISSCKNVSCRFPHKQVTLEEVINALSCLTTDTFIGEYLLLRNWPMLRRKYGPCYVEECISRGLTRCLIEMSIDFCNKARLDINDDAVLKLLVLESTLMYLNLADLDECVDILQYDMADGKQICDIYIETIANGQNFTRFKLVFLKLANFMERIQRRVCIEDVVHILERVCILPYEESLVNAMIKIIFNTDLSIFDNPWMTRFESQLESNKKELFDHFIVLKDVRLKSFEEMNVNNRRNLVGMSNFVEDISSMASDREKSYTSPDTTDIDNLHNKAIEEQVDVRNDMGKMQFRVKNFGSPSSSEEFWPNTLRLKRPIHSPKRGWMQNAGKRGRGSFSPPARMRPPTRGVKRRNVSYGGPAAKFQRRSGPHF